MLCASWEKKRSNELQDVTFSASSTLLYFAFRSLAALSLLITNNSSPSSYLALPVLGLSHYWKRLAENKWCLRPSCSAPPPSNPIQSNPSNPPHPISSHRIKHPAPQKKIQKSKGNNPSSPLAFVSSLPPLPPKIPVALSHSTTPPPKETTPLSTKGEKNYTVTS